MGKVIHREVIRGRMTVTQARRTKEEGLHVESLVYAGSKAEGEPVAEWVLPIQLRYALSDAAKLAVNQTTFPELPESEKDVHTRHCCVDHGCKYGDDDCPVETGVKPQEHPCEVCQFEEEG